MVQSGSARFWLFPEPALIGFSCFWLFPMVQSGSAKFWLILNWI
jgi:hypothetical protein